MKNQKTMGNKGFSLVELIVVIAIMVVLVAVLAPTFTKYVEASRRSTDVQNANSIASAVLADAADGATISNGEITESNKPSGIASVPAVKGKLISSGKFSITYSESTNTCSVVITDGTNSTGDLTQEEAATKYKNAKTTADLN